MRDFRFIVEAGSLGAEDRCYIPITLRYEIDVVHIIWNAALVHPDIYSLLFGRRRTRVLDNNILRGLGICVPRTGIIPTVIDGSRGFVIEPVDLQIARPFESSAHRSPVTERIVRVYISVITGIREIAVVARIVERRIEGVKFVMSLAVMTFTVLCVITIVPVIHGIAGMMSVALTDVRVVTGSPVRVNVFSGHIIRPGLLFGTELRLPRILTRITAFGA